MIYEVGISDVPGARKLPLYNVWANMIQRCYDPKTQAKYPSYKGCSVCNEWLRLSTFLKWAEPRWAPGLQIDKDVLSPGNKVYSPSTCVFVTQALNSLLLGSGASRGKWPIGVTLNKNGFKARCCVDGEAQHLGTFSTPEEAHGAYMAFKAQHIRQIAAEQTDPRIIAGLERHAQLLESR